MSSLLKAWYIFLALSLLTFALTAFVGRAPFALSSAVALPHNLFFEAASNLRETFVSMAKRRDFQAQVARLEERVNELQAENRQLELELERFSQALQVIESQSPGVVMTASVVGVDSSPLISRITLGAGSADGVTENMPVTIPEGLVGLVTAVSEHKASVRAITDPESRVGVTVRGRGGQGIALGELGGRVRVADYYEDGPIEVGDVVETSSRGGLFPTGILVGTVIEVLPKDPNSLRIEFLVQPAVEIPSLLEVALIEPR